MSEVEVETGAEGLVGLLLRLRAHGVTDVALLKAVESVPHERFVPVEHFEKAWQPRALPLRCGQTMTVPDTLIRMVAALTPKTSHSVLEIGTGSGYLTAILAKLAKKVHSVDRYQTLIDDAKERLKLLEIENVSYAKADGQTSGKPPGIYDCIIADMAYEEMPRQLLDQLVAGGVVVTAIGLPRQEQMAVKLTKIGSRFERQDLFPVRLGCFEKGVANTL